MLWMLGSTRTNDSDTASVVSMCPATGFCRPWIAASVCCRPTADAGA